MKLRKIIALSGITLSIGMFGLTIHSIATPQIVKATTYKYANKYYRVKLLKTSDAARSSKPLCYNGQLILNEKYLPAGSIVRIKSNKGNESWAVKSPRLHGKYWTLNYNTRDYSWFSDDLYATIPKNAPYSSTKWFKRHHVITTKRVYAYELANKFSLVHPFVRKIAIPKGTHLYMSKGGDSLHTWGLLGYVHVKGIGRSGAYNGKLWIVRRAKTDWFSVVG